MTQSDLAVIGDEQTLADQITAYFDAGATDVVVAQADLSTEADRSALGRCSAS